VFRALFVSGIVVFSLCFLRAPLRADDPVVSKLRQKCLSSAIPDPLAVVKAIDRVTAKRQGFEQVMAEVKKTLAEHPRLSLREEVEIVKSFHKEVIPLLRKQRTDILKNRTKIDEAYLGYMDALRQAITTLNDDASAMQNRLTSTEQPIRSAEIRDHLIRLAGTGKKTAENLNARLKQAATDLNTINEVMLMVDESGIVLDYWAGQVKAMLEAGERGEAAMKAVAPLKQFAKHFRDAFDAFLAVPDRMKADPHAPAPAGKKNMDVSANDPASDRSGEKVKKSLPAAPRVLSAEEHYDAGLKALDRIELSSAASHFRAILRSNGASAAMRQRARQALAHVQLSSRADE
jgi:hypothetical protein